MLAGTVLKTWLNIKNNVIINIVNPHEGSYVIIDQLGKTIKSFDLYENIVNTLNLENLPEGTYFIKSSSDSKIKSQKFIIKK